MDIGPYRIIRRLGQGGQGIVYLGRDDRGEFAAVKVMNAGIDRSFARELAAARQIDEFCTARVLRADLDHEPPYVASEYIDGPALSTVAPLRGPALTRLAIGTATALTAIHRAGVVHRDFKPGNVLMGPDGPRVIDFGISRLVDVSVSRDGAAGTPPYMAPEQFSGAEVGAPADVFAWGSTMVFASCGRAPFGSDTFAAVAYRILRAEPDFGELPEPLREIVARCLAKDPAVRPAARDLLLELLGETPAAEDSPERQDAALRQGAAVAHPSPIPGHAPPGSGHVPPGPGHPGSGREQTTAPGGDGRAVQDGGVSRRAVLAAGGAVVAAAATTGVVLWRGGLGRAADPVGQGTRSGTPTGSSAPPSPTATPSSTPTPSATPTLTAGPPAPGDLADALESAVALSPMADFTFDGRITQGTWHTTATGSLAYDQQGSDTQMDMRVSAKHISLSRNVVLAGEDYVGGKIVVDPAKTPIMLYARFVHAVVSIATMADLARMTTKPKSKDRVYTGSLPTRQGPEALRRQISAINNDDIPQEQLDKTTLAWKLKLDKDDRPASLRISWHMLLGEGARLTSPFTATFRRWREGEIREPGQ